MNQSGTIENILAQVQTTTVQIGHLKGHFISEAQINAIRDVLGPNATRMLAVIREFGPSACSPADTAGESESSLRARRDTIKKAITKKRIELDSAPPYMRSDLNEEYQQLISERTKIDRSIKALNAI